MKAVNINDKSVNYTDLSGNTYDITADGVKYGYILENPERCTPVEVTARGIVIRNI